MTQLTASRPSTFAFSGGFGFQPVMFRRDSGSLVIQRSPVFRSGTFRDSWGEQMTWEDLHIKQMIDNFDYLRDGKLFDDVPVRDGHPSFLLNGLPGNGKVVGWHTSLFSEKLKAPHDEEEYNYVLADYEITDPEAAAQIENKTWRNKSAEIGRYKTNSEAEFWPVYVGVAYVDIPAVEGLKFSSSNGAGNGAKYFIIDKENRVGQNAPQSPPAQVQPPAQTPAAPAQTPATAPATGALPFSLGATPHVFAVNGQQVTDFAAVQAHINVLEKFVADVTEQGRKDFVAGLATANKITATQVQATEAFAVSLTPDAFEKYKATWEAAPTHPVLGQHGNGVTNPNNSAQQPVDAKEEQYKIWRGTIAQFKSAGLPIDKIKNTPSYKALVDAGQTVNI